MRQTAVRWMLLAGTMGLVLVASGCSRTQRHTLLTFFFEGVPPLEGEATPGEPPPAIAPASPPRFRPETGGSPPSQPQVVGTVHQPYQARLCDACHTFRRGKGSGIAAIDISSRSIIIEPAPGLCYRCHLDKEPTPEALQGAWMHGPVAAGACLFCHNPHRTQTPFLLEADPPGQLCQGCHEPALMHLRPTAPSPGDRDCTACHFGHTGKTRFLLKASLTEGMDLPAVPPALLPPPPPATESAPAPGKSKGG